MLSTSPVFVPETVFLVPADSRKTRSDPIPWVMNLFLFLLLITECKARRMALTVSPLLPLPGSPSPLLCPHLPVKFGFIGHLWPAMEVTQAGVPNASAG